MLPPVFRRHRKGCCYALICCGVSFILLFFFAWRAVFLIAGGLMLLAGCNLLRQ